MATILVIDDEDKIRALFREALDGMGHRVVEARDGLSGLRTFEGLAVDLVITDILMPEQDGLHCILQIRRLNPNVPVIAITGGSRVFSVDMLDVARHFGACRTFLKPLDLPLVLSAVKEELEKAA